MLESAFFLALADLRHMVRRRETWLWAFVMPILFFYFIGTITAGFGGGNGGDALTVVAPPAAGFLADRLISRLEKAGYRVTRLAAPDGVVRDRALILPEEFTASILARHPMSLNFQHRDTGQADDSDKVRLENAIFATVADTVVTRMRGETVDAAALVRLDAMPRPMELVTQAAGKRKVIPSGFEQSVPGSMVFFLLMVMLTWDAVMLVMEREQGILRRLASAPISRGGVVLGKWGSRMMLGVVQVAFCMLTGRVLFHVHWGDHIGAVLLVLLAFGALAASVGLCLGSLAQKRQQAGALGSISSNILAAIGGCWWPAEVMPRAVQTFSKYTPAGMAMDALHQLVNFGADPMVVWPYVAALSAMAVVAGYLASRLFRFQ